MMNKTEAKAKLWLEKQGYINLTFSSNKNPDFITPSGEGFEIKKSRNNVIVFSDRQFRDLTEIEDSVVVLVFNDNDEPIAQIPFTEIKEQPIYWNNIRILVSIMSKPRPSVISEFLTVNDIAEQLSVHPQTVYRWIYNGKLEARRIDGIIRIDKVAYYKFIGEGKEVV